MVAEGRSWGGPGRVSAVGSGPPPRWSIHFPSAGSCSPTSQRTSRPRAWWRSCVSASARPSMLPSWRVLRASTGLGETLLSGVLLSLTTPSLPTGLSGSTGTWPTACLSCPSQSGVSTRCLTILTALAINCQTSRSSVPFCPSWASCGVGPSLRARCAAPAAFRPQLTRVF